MKLQVLQFIQLMEHDGVNVALKRTFRYVQQQLILRNILLPILGKHPDVYRLYTNLHPGYSDADPFKIIRVDPTRITHTSEKSREQLYGKVAGGTWDRPKDKLVELDKYRGLREYLETGNPRPYLDVFEEIRRGADWSYSGQNSASNRLTDIDTLIDSLRTDGYRSQNESTADEMNGNYANDRPTLVNEITVDIGRDGTLYYCGRGGSHRLFLSQLLSIEYVPVQVATRHAMWQQKRDAIRCSDTIDDVAHHSRDYIDHPDMQDVHPDVESTFESAEKEGVIV